MNDAGRIGFVIRGEYDPLFSYDFLDVVYYDSASYVAKKLTVGNEPQESNEYWQILAKSNTLTNISDATVKFTQAETRTNIQSGEDGKTLFGKIKKWFADLKPVAFTGSFRDLSDQPTIPSIGNGTLTIQKNGANVQTFSANQAGDVTANITVPTIAADVGAVATSKILTSVEQIDANTDLTNVAGATAVKSLKSDLTNSINQINSNLTRCIQYTGFQISSIQIAFNNEINAICLYVFWTDGTGENRESIFKSI